LKYNIFVIAFERRSHTASVGWKSLAFFEKADHDNNPKIGFDYIRSHDHVTINHLNLTIIKWIDFTIS
jgi:hypothetical protein